MAVIIYIVSGTEIAVSKLLTRSAASECKLLTRSAASEFGRHCLHSTLKGIAGLERVMLGLMSTDRLYLTSK